MNLFRIESLGVVFPILAFINLSMIKSPAAFMRGVFPDSSYIY